MASYEQILPDYIVASSDEMRELTGVVRTVAPTMITVLLTGESGTGKEVFARLIHDLSPRKSGPFITVNCGAIPEGLIESELFGHEKGSFTGASADRKGFFEAAHDGTIFLDEIGEMSLSAQVKLLRVLETGKFTRVGSTKERTTNARIIAATNRDLEIEVRTGRFRADLYYRLRAVMLRLPPLRNRRDDIPFLVDSILRDIVSRHSLPHIPHIEGEAIEFLVGHEWRGNIRELRNILEQLSIVSFSPQRGTMSGEITKDDVLKALSENQVYFDDGHSHLSPIHIRQQEQTDRPELALIYKALIELRGDIADIREHLLRQSPPPMQLSLPAPKENGVIKTLDDVEKETILTTIEQCKGNRKLAAELLGVSDRTLYRKLQEYEEK
jgi:transcriptional regulator with PAS, ATPase and Fis domain